MNQNIQATILSRRKLNPSIWEYCIQPEHYIPYHAGQYLQIITHDAAYPYSIANAPFNSSHYELHIRHTKAHLEPGGLADNLHPGQKIILNLPYGRCDLAHLDPHKSILFIAAGTGFSSIRAMIDDLLQTTHPQPFELYWGVHARHDLYAQDDIRRWKTRLPHLHYVPQISQETEQSLIHTILTDHPHDLKDWQVVMAGPFELIYTLRDALILAGVPQDALFSDAFDFI